jgi:hypothetical protein
VILALEVVRPNNEGRDAQSSCVIKVLCDSNKLRKSLEDPFTTGWSYLYSHLVHPGLQTVISGDA